MNHCGHHHAPGLRWWLGICVAILIIVSAGTLVLLARVNHNTERLDRIVRQTTSHAQEDEQALRAATYRICVRQMQVRAAIILHVDRTPNNRLLRVLPIFDCTPDLKGMPARELTPSDTRAFLRHFDHDKALAP